MERKLWQYSVCVKTKYLVKVAAKGKCVRVIERHNPNWSFGRSARLFQNDVASNHPLLCYFSLRYASHSRS